MDYVVSNRRFFRGEACCLWLKVQNLAWGAVFVVNEYRVHTANGMKRERSVNTWKE